MSPTNSLNNYRLLQLKASVNSSNPYVSLLNRAREQWDVAQLIKLIPSTTQITIDSVVLHPWAENPQSVGALAVSQLGIYTSRKEARTEKLVAEVMRMGALESLLQCLSATQRDRKEAALLALSFLSEDCMSHTGPQICEKLLQLNALFLIMSHLKDTKEGVRSTALFCCRNLYLSRPTVQHAFVDAQGVIPLCDLLASKDNLIVFETLLNILDLLLVIFT